METFKSEYNQAMNISYPVVRDIGRRFVSIDFPSERIIDGLGKVLREKYQDNILIINMSEREYNEDQLPGHAISANFRGLPAPPLDMLCRLCLQIHQWLSRSPANVVAVHCFPGLSRSAVLVSCYLAWSGAHQHPVDALVDVCAGLKVDLEMNPILPSQKRYLNDFYHFLVSDSSGLVSEPESSLSLTQLILSGVPNLPVSETSEFRPFFEIWKDGKLIQSSLPAGASSVEELVAQVPTYAVQQDPLSLEESCVVSFPIGQNVPLLGDLLFRIRHLTQSGGRFTCLRFAVNARQHVVDGTLHLGRQEIDGNGFSSCMIDAKFEKGDTVEDFEEFKRNSDVLKRCKETSFRFRSGTLRDEDCSTDDIEEVLLLKALGKKESSSSASVPAPQVMGNEAISDEVDDFFAQLEKEAQIYLILIVFFVFFSCRKFLKKYYDEICLKHIISRFFFDIH